MCHASELPVEAGVKGDAALFARPALDAEVGSGVLAHLCFPAEFEAAGESLERGRRRRVGVAADVNGGIRVAAKLILDGCADNERTALLRDRPARTCAQTLALHGVEVVAFPCGELRIGAVLPRVEVADVQLALAAALLRDALTKAQMCADVVRIGIIGGQGRGVVHRGAAKAQAALVERAVLLLLPYECTCADVADGAVAVRRVHVAVVGAASVFDDGTEDQSLVATRHFA